VDLCRNIIEEEKTNQLETSESDARRSENPHSVRAFFASLPTASTPEQSDTLHPTVEVEFIGRLSQPQRVFLLGRDSTGIVVRDREVDSGIVHFYPWSSIFSLTP
jgi:hypothetical protein